MAERDDCFDTNKTIKVRGLRLFLESKLQIHFQSKRNNGGDVGRVHLYPDGDEYSALIEFDNPKGNCNIICKRCLIMVHAANEWDFGNQFSASTFTFVYNSNSEQ